jgi:hypothetical protein
MDVPQYLSDRNADISEFNQLSEGWKNRYSKLNNKSFPLIKKVYENYTSKPLNRSSIVDLYKNEEQLDYALVSTLMWGLIDSTGKTKFLESINSDIKHNVEKLKKVRNLLAQNDLKEAYMSMLSGKVNNIRGLDYAYFTKILYFIGQSFENLNPKPLIFDRWSSHNYLALLLNLGCEHSMNKAKKYYKGISINFDLSSPGQTIIKSNRPSWEMYNSFITDYNLWADELKVSSSQIEEYTFGFELNNIDDNPRRILWKIITDNYFKLLKTN